MVTTKKVYVILNNGFFEGKQNRLAVENMEHWCNRVGFTMAQGIGIGGGGMLSGIEGVPYGKGPKARIGKALEAMATNILSGQGADFTFMEPNFPGVAYKLAAEIGWRQGIRKNGLKTKDLGRRL